MKKAICFVLCGVMVMGLLTGCSTPKENTESPAAEKQETQGAAEASKGYKIGMTVLDISNPFFVSMKTAAENYAKENNCEFYFVDSKGTSEGQIQALENFLNIGVDAIIITAQDAEAVMPYIKEAREKGIVVVAHTTKLEEYDAYVGADEYTMGFCLGEAAGKWVEENLSDQEEVLAATLNYDIASNVIPRKEGIIEGVESVTKRVKFVATATAGETQPGMEAAETFIQTYPDIQVLLGINDGGALGAYEAFMAAGKDGDDILIGGIDATEEALQKIKSDSIYRITVDQDPAYMGELCVEDCIKAIKGEEFEKDYYVDLIAVTKDNIGEYVK